MKAIVFYEAAYDMRYELTDHRRIKFNDKKVIDLPDFYEMSNEEIEEWIEEFETDVAKETLEKDFKNRNNVDVSITNIVKLWINFLDNFKIFCYNKVNRENKKLTVPICRRL